MIERILLLSLHPSALTKLKYCYETKIDNSAFCFLCGTKHEGTDNFVRIGRGMRHFKC